ncbi:hypothetical protein [Streptomyces roseochromogenus]|uniref:Uncharacterized protein n=1 Tax=Streptomyces roseochromogenus subsp. oscitans DS 12.976 TaxID=1352936 RepID=V6JU44_STRRC|nr:hypothetical protein [Streptomyces roseochromogenus]EST20409.1 hypothetical protein M878_39640 [Streptomyces roseochromogenus subsp. oscitans DS 12.976]
MTIAQLMQEQQVDALSLPLAPASLPMHVIIDRIITPEFWPCAACGCLGVTARVLDTEEGPRWLDLCWDHGMNVHQPSPGMPMTMEGIVAGLRAAAEAVGARLAILNDDDSRGDSHGRAGSLPPHG